MPLYLVRHPEAKVSLVYANSVLEMYTATDCGQYVSRRPCTFREYTKPLCLTFHTQTPVLHDRYASLDLIEEPDTTNECLNFSEQLLESGLYSDITLVVDGHEFHCHKAILANRCEYFRVMFQSDMKESQSVRINLGGHSLLVVTQVLRFIYTGRVTIPTLNSEGDVIVIAPDDGTTNVAMDAREMALFFHGLLKAADFYGLVSLGKLCVRKIAECCLNKNIYLREDFLSYMYQLAVEHNCETLKNFVAGALCSYVEDDISGQTGHDIVENLLPPDLSQLVSHLSGLNRQGGLRQARDEDVIASVISSSHDIAKIKQALEAAINEGHLTQDSCALHTVCKIYIRSNPASGHDISTWRQLWRGIMDLFMAYHFDINHVNAEGDTALHVACRGDAEKIMSDIELSVMLLQWLLKHGANPLMQNRKGYTPLDEAYSHLNRCLPLVASYYFHGEDGMQFISRSSLVQDFADKINCLMRQEILLQSAMVEWTDGGGNALGDAQANHCAGGRSHSITKKKTEEQDQEQEEEEEDEEEADEVEDCNDSEQSNSDDDDSEQQHNDDDDDSEPHVLPQSRYMFNKAFLNDNAFTQCAFPVAPSDVCLGAGFGISGLIGDNENGHSKEKFQNEVFKFMYPRLHSELQNVVFMEGGKSGLIEDEDILSQLESAAVEDSEAAASIRGSGLPLQSVDTMALMEATFDDALRDAAEICMTSYSELLANITLVA